MHNRTKKRSQDRQGATTVEFALTAPILFMLIMGAVEFSRANMLRHTVVVAATEGARRSIIPGATAAECEQAATQELAMVGFRSADIIVDPSVITENTTQVTVDITVPLSGDNGFVIPNFFKGAKIRKAVSLQREGAIENPSSERSNGNSLNGNGNAGAGNNGNGLGNN